MAQIIPFRGVLYNQEKIEDMSLVVSPPYDVISVEAQENYYNNHENNVVRLILGKEFAEDNSENNKYTRAADYFKRWLEESILKQDNKPSIYIDEEEYVLRSGEKKKRRGFIALVKLEDFEKGIIRPHEKTLAGPKADRLRLMRACKANFSQVFSLYSDLANSIDQILQKEMEEPIIDIFDEIDIRHRLWRVSNSEAIDKVKKLMEDKELFIADGHHRYETALNFCNEMKRLNPNHTGLEAYNYVMMYFSNIDDPELTILPTHRLIREIPDLKSDNLLKEIEKYFVIDTFEFSSSEDDKEQRKKMFAEMKEKEQTEHIFGMYCQGKTKYYTLTLKNEKFIDDLGDKTKSEAWRKLDVSILHTLIFNEILGLEKRGLNVDDCVTYTKNKGKAVKLVNDGEYQMIFFLNPVKVSQVKEIANAGEIMPPKSTYFYPKLLTGLVINKIDI